MIIQVKDRKTKKFLGCIAGYTIYDTIAYALVAKDGKPLEDYKVEDLIVITVIEEGAEK